MSKLLETIRTRLAKASINDRRYERPMSWEEADKLILEIDAIKGVYSRPESCKSDQKEPGDERCN